MVPAEPMPSGDENEPVEKSTLHASSPVPEGARARRREDLTTDHNLRGASSIQIDGDERPSLGRIALLSRLGKGGMGVVYYGVNPRLGTEVAVKILPRNLEEQHEGIIQRFVREAQLAAKLQSEHLVTVLDVDQDPATGAHYLVMEYVRGQSAGVWLRGQRSAGNEGVPENRALDVCIAATRGLEAAHVEGVIHRDIKPDNILIPSDGGGRLQYRRSKLADLGLARPDDEGGGLTNTNVALGTPGYMAPEQAQDARTAKKPADVFAMGCTLYALLIGEPPFPGETSMQVILNTIQGNLRPIRSVRPGVSRAIETLLHHCLDGEPSKRYPDASALLEALLVCRVAVEREQADSELVTTEISSFVMRSEQGKRVITPAELASWADNRPVAPRASGASDPPRTPVPPRAATPLPSHEAPTMQQDASTVVLPPPQGSQQAAGSAPAVPTGSAGGGSGKWIALVGLLAAVVVAAIALGPQLFSREPASLVLRGGPPGARVTLQPPDGAAVTFSLDADGSHRLADIAAGAYRLRVEEDGHRMLERSVELQAGRTRDMDVRLTLLPGTLLVLTQPKEAVVRIDGTVVTPGPGGLEVAPGQHELRVSLEGRVEHVRQFEVAAGEETDLGTVRLGKLPVIDLGGLAVDVVVRDGQRRVRDGETMLPGPRDLVLERPGYAPQVVSIDPRPDGTVHVEAEDWSRFQAGIDVSKLPAGVSAWIDGTEVRSRRTFPGAGRVEIEWRAAHGETDTSSEVVELGSIPEVAPPSGSLVLRTRIELPDDDVSVWIDGHQRADGDLIPAGTLQVIGRREGFEEQAVALEAEPGMVARPQFGAWTRIGADEEPAKTAKTATPAEAPVGKLELLKTWTAWSAASEAERVATAELVAERVSGFTYLRIESMSAAGKTHRVALYRHSGSGLEFALVAGGTFDMGSPTDEVHQPDETLHVVTLGPFLIARTEVSQKAWARVMGTGAPADAHRGAALPKDSVTWLDAVDFCQRAGLELPTEAQWEYACRGGAQGRFGAGDATTLGEFAVCDLDWASGPLAVPMPGDPTPRKPNAYGLFDMHGNVWEWCRDWYAHYGVGKHRASDGLHETDGTERVKRGGCYYLSADYIRSARRAKGPMAESAPGELGFRPALTLPLPE